MSKFTPGPWRAQRMDTPFNFKNGDENYFGVLAVEPMRGRIDSSLTGMSRANAALISAAPEMYEALKQAKEFVENLQLPDAEWTRILDCIIVALAKAVPHE